MACVIARPTLAPTASGDISSKLQRKIRENKFQTFAKQQEAVYDAHDVEYTKQVEPKCLKNYEVKNCLRIKTKFTNPRVVEMNMNHAEVLIFWYSSNSVLKRLSAPKALMVLRPSMEAVVWVNIGLRAVNNEKLIKPKNICK